ncbi:hypothetical protein [Glycomyces terrestris]|uniref:Uncharacterized protein n=1 Tax=Glycomyces terrestris TaxID=2493553 RepID=A0A426UZR5_9ACTN|nr:hypothetical protein [Glycomyces terrestris]RRS00110.1 hypothetical protein EIW28_05810 [Glycomyces terrestris]
MRHRFPLIVAAAAALLLSGAVPAAAAEARPVPAGSGSAAEAGHAVDITLAERKGACEAAGVPVGAAPPLEVRIESDEVAFDCSGSIRFRLGRDTRFAFDDAAGTATADVIRVVATKFGVTCGYEATDVVFRREGLSREYAGGPYTGRKVQGSFLCPKSVQLDRAAFAFH